MHWVNLSKNNVVFKLNWIAHHHGLMESFLRPNFFYRIDSWISFHVRLLLLWLEKIEPFNVSVLKELPVNESNTSCSTHILMVRVIEVFISLHFSVIWANSFYFINCIPLKRLLQLSCWLNFQSASLYICFLKFIFLAALASWLCRLHIFGLFLADKLGRKFGQQFF